MRITLCGSIAFIDEMNAVREELEFIGNDVKMPPLEILDDEDNFISVKEYYSIRKLASYDEKWVWKRKAEAIRNHFEKVAWSDVILILNYDKNGIESYIGANTLLEMGLAFYLKKPIYLYQSIPDISYKEEIFGMQPIILNGDLSKI